ncbi:N-acetylmuramic acid 6-phosphate etherase [Streptomonospora nanhaiensis]|uniref:N-acetylmuramic acid 6-phosphate etherase n=1 Tax=Streptomonospora nanhaiensis TaxID=1323731 RepID=A0A853BTE7_9ACTN|nr:N-acetylmuramic acid 6-phosphate etherase [Streptomonospora nanhaiensis]MBX9391660.1 N-acetylmuramic acid 6-phosphate etherase [Streptomonospora nanhaiensis]NYI98413.1 N-acetylmuramic acid 6-phosphate etherase [Streptomonospora nanhaiensis]
MATTDTSGAENSVRGLRADLAGLATEARRTDLAGIDRMGTEAIVRAMNDEDRAVAPAVAAAAPAIAAAVDAIAERMNRGGRLIYVGAGTAGRMGVLDASECPPTFNTAPGQVVGLIAGGPTAIHNAVEGAEDDTEAAVADLEALALVPDDTVVGISASGRTPYSVAAVRHAAGRGALTVGVSSNPGSPLGAAADHAIEVETGPELIAGSTRLKAGTAQKLVLNTLSTVTMIRLGKTYGNLMVDLRSTNEKLRVRAHRIVEMATGADEDEVRRALSAAGGHVKTAILTILGRLDAEEAARLLDASGGRLREAVESAAPRD